MLRNKIVRIYNDKLLLRFSYFHIFFRVGLLLYLIQTKLWEKYWRNIYNNKYTIITMLHYYIFLIARLSDRENNNKVPLVSKFGKFIRNMFLNNLYISKLFWKIANRN